MPIRTVLFFDETGSYLIIFYYIVIIW